MSETAEVTEPNTTTSPERESFIKLLAEFISHSQPDPTPTSADVLTAGK